MIGRTQLAILATLAATACGGGGGGSDASTDRTPRILVADVVLDAGADSGALEIGFGIGETEVVLLQFDLATDAGLVQFDGSVRALQGTPTIEANVIDDGRLRVVVGDAGSRQGPRVVPDGAIVRVPFTILGASRPFAAEVRVEGVVASGAEGAAIEVSAPTESARVEVR